MAYLYVIHFGPHHKMLITQMEPMCQRALVWGSLSHENVLPLLGIYEGKYLHFVTPDMEHGTLSQWRQSANPSGLEIRDRVCLISLSWLALTYFSQMLEVARAVRYIHSLGLVLCWLDWASGVCVYIVSD